MDLTWRQMRWLIGIVGTVIGGGTYLLPADTSNLLAYSLAATGALIAIAFGTLRTILTRGWRPRVFLLTFFFWAVTFTLALGVYRFSNGAWLPDSGARLVRAMVATAAVCLPVVIRRPTMAMYRAWRNGDESPEAPPDSTEGLLLGADPNAEGRTS